MGKKGSTESRIRAVVDIPISSNTYTRPLFGYPRIEAGVGGGEKERWTSKESWTSKRKMDE